MGKEVGIYASFPPTLPHLPDCDLHCKPARGSYRISLKKFCRKDYGRQPSGLLPPIFSPCTSHFPLGYPDPCWAPSPSHISQVHHCRWPRPVSPWWPVSPSAVSVLSVPRPRVQCVSPVSLFCPPSRPATNALSSSARPAPSQPDPAPSRLPRSGAGGGGRARRGAWLVDALPGGRARRVPERRGACAAWEQRAVGARARCGLRLPTPIAGAQIPAAGGRARDRGRGSRGPRARAQRRPREPRAALARRVDATPSEAAAARATGSLRGGLSSQAGLGSGGALLTHQGVCSTSAFAC